MTKHTPEPWAIQSLFPENIVPLKDVNLAFGASIHPKDYGTRFARVIARAESSPLCPRPAKANARCIVAAHNATYAAGINPEAVPDLLSFAVAMAENDSDECVRNAAREIVIKAKPGWRPKP